MDGNAYTSFRNSAGFPTAKDVVDGLAEYFLAEYGSALSQHESAHLNGILKDVSWDDMERIGERTRHEVTAASYEYERPQLSIRVSARLDSDDYTYRECVCSVTLGYEIGSLIGSGERAHARFHIDEDGVVTT